MSTSSGSQVLVNVRDDVVRVASVEPQNEGGLDVPETVAVYNWAERPRCGCCGCFGFVTQLVLVGCCGSFVFGLGLSLLNTSISYIGWEYEWCDFANGTDSITGCRAFTLYNAFISTAVFIGCAGGSMAAGLFASYGRRQMMIISMTLVAFGVVSSCCANSFAALLWARLMVGFGGGMLTVGVPGYMAEVTPAAVRGKYGVFHQLFISTGIFVGTLVGLPLNLVSTMPEGEGPGLERVDTFARVWWRVMLGLGIIPVSLLLYLVTFVYTFETPIYYAEHGQFKDAENLLMLIYNKEDVRHELHELVQDVRDAQASQAAGMTLGVAMKRPDLRRCLIYGTLLSAFQQLGGINVFIASSNKLFSSAGLKGVWPTVVSILMNLLLALMTLPAVPLIEKLGRKQLLLMGTIGKTISMAPAAICYWALPEDSKVTLGLAIAGVMLFIVCFGISYGPVLWVYLSEMFPTEIKGAAAGMATSINWLCGVVLVFASSFLDNKVNYTIFTIMCLISVLVIQFGILETKGLPLGVSPYVQKA